MYAHIKQYSPNFMDKAVLTISTQDTFVTFRTFDAFYGKSQRIYIRISKLEAWIEDEDEDYFEDRDLQSSIRLYRHKDKNLMELISLRENDGELKGFIHRFSIDTDRLAYILTTRNEEHKLLINIREQNRQAKLNMPESTQAYIRDSILPDHRLRRAFVKAVSRNFMYGEESSVLLAPDYDGFFFRESVGEKRGICGGLILSRSKVAGKDGRQHEAFAYSIHT